MKILCFILSFYVLCLAAMPCCADENCNDDIKTETTDHHSHDHKDRECKSCSPFFTCGTCSGFVFTSSSFYFSAVLFIKDEFVIAYKSQFIDDFLAKIWQPPKIR